MKKSKKVKRKGKESGKLKGSKSRAAPPPLPPELRGLDTKWWYDFLNKHAESGERRAPHPPFLSFCVPLAPIFLNFLFLLAAFAQIRNRFVAFVYILDEISGGQPCSWRKA
jgi:hypothetical protein